MVILSARGTVDIIPFQVKTVSETFPRPYRGKVSFPTNHESQCRCLRRLELWALLPLSPCEPHSGAPARPGDASPGLGFHRLALGNPSALLPSTGLLTLSAVEYEC